MSTTDYDVVTIGGGLAGAGFGRLMAEKGTRALVLERSTDFRDRVRGEVLVPWGVAEAKALGFDTLLRPVGNDLRRWDFSIGGSVAMSLDIAAASRLGVDVLTYYHPQMQEILLGSAEQAGAKVRRGARVLTATPGRPLTVSFEHEGRTHEVSTRLVVGADGRGSAARGWGGFTLERDTERRLFAGILFEDVSAPEDVLFSGFLPGTGLMTYVFPQGRGRARCYVGFQKGSPVERFSGPRDVSRFIDTAVRIGAAKEWYAGAKPNGPLATFDATDEWVSHPYRDGIALVGDAAATSDPTWGQGMSVTLRDLHLLRDALLANEDWDVAGHAYADAHDAFHREVHRADGWYTDLFCDVGAEADALRARAFPAILADPTRILATPLGGPEIRADDAARRLFFAEDLAA